MDDLQGSGGAVWDGGAEDTMEDVVADVAGVFAYDGDSRPQDRAHAYLREHRVARGYDDTAMQCSAEGMVRRAYRIGLTENVRAVARETARVIADGIRGVLDGE